MGKLVLLHLFNAALLLFLQAALAADPQNCGPGASNAVCPLAEDKLASCCSIAGFCGNSSAYCGAGCQSAFSAPGKCNSPSSPGANTTNSTTPAPTPKPTTPAPTPASAPLGPECGVNPHNTSQDYGTCKTPGYCCSPFGYCGFGDEYCVGCQPKHGYCPKQCDANTNFCGPVSKATFALSFLSILVAIFGAVVAVKAFLKP